jgi:adenylate kinase
MIIALTGTPGTGKTSVSKFLEETYFVIDLNKLAIKENFITGIDEDRNSKIIDINRLDNYIDKNYNKKSVVFVEGHLSHLLKSVDKVIILRCNPNVLIKRLSKKGWNKEKIKENLEAEILDIILCETVDIHSDKNIFEIDTSKKSIRDIASLIKEIIKSGFRNVKTHNIGNIDWSEEILKKFV